MEISRKKDENQSQEQGRKENISAFVAAGQCAGCGACIAICPKDALNLRENAAGFLEAAVKEDLCVGCGLCQKICPRLHEKVNCGSDCCAGEQESCESRDLRDSRLYALQSAGKDTVLQCSSGGVAHELAEAFLAEGGKVVGAVYDLTADRVRHRMITEQTQLPLLDGSKYLQSNTAEAFATALWEAKQSANAQFLVFGTPCQIAGMAAATQEAGVRNQFLLTEIFCHGVPSTKVWEDTLGRVRKKLKTDQFDAVRFRYKKDDWHTYCLRIDAKGRSWYGKRETELFWQAFFENILLNDACWDCKARCQVSHADLRLGDYWGARFQHRSDGISAVFALTDKGEKAIAQLLEQKRLQSFPAGSPEEMLRAQNMAGYSQRRLHDKAMESLRKGADLRQVVKTYRKGFNGRQKLKGFLLVASTILPDGLRARLRKKNSARKVRDE